MADRLGIRFVVVDVDLFDHPKVLRAGPTAALAFVMALAHSRKFLTDGRVDPDVMERLAGWAASETNGAQNAADTVKTLTEVNLLRTTRRGYVIHDYARYQQTRGEVEAASLRGKRAARKRWGAHADGMHDACEPHADRMHARAVQNRTEHIPPNPMHEHQEEQGARARGANPRATGTNPRRLRKTDAQYQLAVQYVQTQGSEYPNDDDLAAALGDLFGKHLTHDRLQQAITEARQ